MRLRRVTSDQCAALPPFVIQEVGAGGHGLVEQDPVPKSGHWAGFRLRTERAGRGELMTAAPAAS